MIIINLVSAVCFCFLVSRWTESSVHCKSRWLAAIIMGYTVVYHQWHHPVMGNTVQALV